MINRTCLASILLFLNFTASTQVEYEILEVCPEAISNAAVTSVTFDDSTFVYVFSGIDESKSFAGIHARGYKFNRLSNTWTSIPDLPGGQPRIAAGASTINGLIYILGGYQVFADGSELSINSLHIFDPSTDTFLPNAAPIPTPIDDHVQAVYKDSLLYSFTGWSNSANVNETWMYDPLSDSWTECTALPAGPIFSSFGASGSIVGDTIYFIGGASEIGPFNLSDRFRKGYIHPEDPSKIDWIIEKTDNAIGYRMGSGVSDGKVFWIGGSQTSYNYDGIAYNGTGGVNPLSRLLVYDPVNGSFTESVMQFPAIMDLRGLAQVGPTEFIGVGGMIDQQEVSDQVVLYTIDISSDTHSKQNTVNVVVAPNPASNYVSIDCQGDQMYRNLTIYTIEGVVIDFVETPRFPVLLDCRSWNNGMYFYEILGENNMRITGAITK